MTSNDSSSQEALVPGELYALREGCTTTYPILSIEAVWPQHHLFWNDLFVFLSYSERAIDPTKYYKLILTTRGAMGWCNVPNSEIVPFKEVVRHDNEV